MEVIIKASQFLLSLSILIVLHELGHFIPAKLFKTRVEKFYLFFDYKFSLFKKKIGETEYGIGWIPLGGYVKISGMIDESMDKDQMKEEPKDWEMRSKPAWQRLIIMLGGVTVNLILAMIIFSGVFWKYGQDQLPIENMNYGIECMDTFALNMGLQNGDKIIQVGDEKIEKFKDVVIKMVLNEADHITVLRDGKEKTIQVPYHFNRTILSRKRKGFVEVRFPYMLDSVLTDQPFGKAGLQSGDYIVGINDQTTFSYYEFRRILDQHPEEEVSVYYQRNGQVDTAMVKLDSAAYTGSYIAQPSNFVKIQHTEFTFAESWPAGIGQAMSSLHMTVKQLPLMFSSKTQGWKSMSGFIGMGNLFAATWDWRSFWWMTAFISVMLAFMNVLPIPALDGGHVVFLIYEMVTRKKPSDKFLEYAQVAGFFFLISLLLYANGNDVYKLIFE